MSRLRVALVLERFEPQRGGTETYAAELVRRLRRRGHDVTVVAAQADESALHGAPLRRIAVPAVPRAWRVWAFARRAERATAGQFDVVHGLQKSLGHTVFQPHTGSHRASLAAARAAHGSVLARLTHAVGKWCSLKQWVFAALERRQYAQQPPPVFVAVSPLVRRQMIELHGVPPAAIRVVPNPVDTERFQPSTAEERAATRARIGTGPGDVKRVALWVGTQPQLKGLEAAALAAGAGAFDELWVAGRVGAAMQARVARRADGGRFQIRFLGRVEDVAPLYGAADGLLLPTAYDPAPLVVLEALASGCPVLTTAACGLADTVRGSGGQVVADRNDSGAMALAAHALATGPRPSEAFRAQLIAQHGWDAHCTALEDVYFATQ